MLAAGGGDFGLAPIVYYLQARAEEGGLPVRYVIPVHKRNSIAGLVRADSSLSVAADLEDRTVGGPVGGVGLGWLMTEYGAAMLDAGLRPSRVMAMAYPEAIDALGEGRIDAVPNLAELLPLVQRRAGVPLRAIPLGVRVYSSGLLASDSVSADVVAAMQAAVAAALERQRVEPTRGCDELVRRYPDVRPDDAVDSWSHLEPFVFVGDEKPASASSECWHRSMHYTAAVHRLSSPQSPWAWRAVDTDGEAVSSRSGSG